MRCSVNTILSRSSSATIQVRLSSCGQVLTRSEIVGSTGRSPPPACLVAASEECHARGVVRRVDGDGGASTLLAQRRPLKNRRSCPAEMAIDVPSPSPIVANGSAGPGSGFLRLRDRGNAQRGDGREHGQHSSTAEQPHVARDSAGRARFARVLDRREHGLGEGHEALRDRVVDSGAWR